MPSELFEKAQRTAAKAKKTAKKAAKKASKAATRAKERARENIKSAQIGKKIKGMTHYAHKRSKTAYKKSKNAVEGVVRRLRKHNGSSDSEVGSRTTPMEDDKENSSPGSERPPRHRANSEDSSQEYDNVKSPTKKQSLGVVASSDGSPAKQPPAQSSGSAEKKLRQVLVIHDFHPSDGQRDCLAIVCGMILRVENTTDSKYWWFGETQEGSRGWFPPACATLTIEDAKMTCARMFEELKCDEGEASGESLETWLLENEEVARDAAAAQALATKMLQDGLFYSCDIHVGKKKKFRKEQTYSLRPPQPKSAEKTKSGKQAACPGEEAVKIHMGPGDGGTLRRGWNTELETGLVRPGDGGTLKHGFMKYLTNFDQDHTDEPATPGNNNSKDTHKDPPNKPSPLKFLSERRPSFLQRKPKAPKRKAPVKPTPNKQFTDEDIANDQAVLAVGVAEDANPRYRPSMEDGHVVDYYVGSSQSRGNEQAFGFFAVYDGHGGRAAVNLLLGSLHEKVSEHLEDVARGLIDPTQALEKAFLETDLMMRDDNVYEECGSTVVCALVWPQDGTGERELYIANSGDARAVVAVIDTGMDIGLTNSGEEDAVAGGGGEPYGLIGERLSVDHKPDLAEERDRIRKEGGWVAMGRINGTLAVSRALGDWSYKNCGLTAIPHQSSILLTPRHRFLILACDGLWDVVGDTEAVQAVAHLSDEDEMARTLVDIALKKGSTDNISVMVLRLQA